MIIQYHVTIHDVLIQALLKKHEALMSDIDAYGGVIDQLREQAQACKVGIFTAAARCAASNSAVRLFVKNPKNSSAPIINP